MLTLHRRFSFYHERDGDGGGGGVVGGGEGGDGMQTWEVIRTELDGIQLAGFGF